jgi:hypothetical protein
MKYLMSNIYPAVSICSGNGSHEFSAGFEVVAAAGGGGLLP